MIPGCPGYRLSRRDVFRVGGASLFGMSMADFFQAKAHAAGKKGPPAKQMILLWMAGGPPHQDMFDMKPETPPPFGSELKQGKTKVPGMEFCDLMPRLAQNADKFSILRSVGIGSEKWEHSGGLYWLCGNPRTKDTPKYPMYGSVVAHERQPIKGVPTFVAFGHYYDTGDAAGDLRNNYLGPAYDPLTFRLGHSRQHHGGLQAGLAEGGRPAGQPGRGPARPRPAREYHRRRAGRDGPQQDLEGPGLFGSSRPRSLGHDAVRLRRRRWLQERH